MNNISVLLSEWKQRASQAEVAHFKQAARYNKLRYVTELPSSLLGFIVGGALFTDLARVYPIKTGLISLASGMAGLVHILFRFKERADEHKKAATGWSKVRREIELRQAVMDLDTDYINKLKDQIDRLSEESPVVQEHIWEFAMATFKQVKL